MFPVILVAVSASYFSGLMFFAWAGGIKLSDALERKRPIMDDDVMFWWFWSALLFVVYPLCVAVYMCVKGMVLLVREAKRRE